MAVTGLGVVSPLGIGVEVNWQGLLAGRSGIGLISRFPVDDIPVKIAGEVPDFDPERWIEPKDRKKTDPFIQYALAASVMAMEDSGLVVDDALAPRAGCIVGVGIGGLETIENTMRTYLESGPRRLSPFFIPKLIGNLAPGWISMRFGLRGPNYATTSACASGAHAIGEAFRAIRDGYMDCAVAGGTEAGVTALGVLGFSVMRALSTCNDAPTRASRPFDRARDGFVMGEGAGIVVLEEWQAAERRGARIHGEVLGYGASADAFHITQPAPEGRGAVQCMRAALDDAGVEPESVGHINAHGTSTPFNDANETRAIHAVFGAHAARLPVSSTKSMTGHLLGAAGGVEAVYSILALREGILPPTINYEEPDPECDLDYVPGVARHAEVEIALSNSFGFGGTNATLVFRRTTGAGG